MVRSLAGQQRITLAEARAENRLAGDAWRAHRKVCLSCKRAHDSLYGYCDAGWQMAKRASRAAYQLRKFAEAEVKGQGQLW